MSRCAWPGKLSHSTMTMMQQLPLEEELIRIFQQKDQPDEIPDFRLSEDMLEDGLILLPKLAPGSASSTSNDRRLIQQGAVKVGGEKI
ncbi:hypothetical protein [Pelotomaculum schinkii]|uniref:hypothetical protein n=1 Tax=Pelotomaculum schinkii TaxID=78350 RepID=UPI00167DEF67|nr:hypothetical protein [Pelotomaculum schinkii]